MSYANDRTTRPAELCSVKIGRQLYAVLSARGRTRETRSSPFAHVTRFTSYSHVVCIVRYITPDRDVYLKCIATRLGQDFHI